MSARTGERSRASSAGLEGLGPLDTERAESMGAEGGRSAQMVSAGFDAPRPRPDRWLLFLSLATLTMAGVAVYRRLRLPAE